MLEHSEAHNAFEARFHLGMSRSEVNQILLEIDPNIQGMLKTDEAFWEDPCGWIEDANECVDGIVVFGDTFIVQYFVDFYYFFVYDQDFNLIRLYRPGS